MTGLLTSEMYTPSHGLLNAPMDEELRFRVLAALQLCMHTDCTQQYEGCDTAALRARLKDIYCCMDTSELTEEVVEVIESVLQHEAKMACKRNGIVGAKPRVTEEHALTPFATVNSTQVSIWRGDITRLSIDAIVNPASHPYLLGCYQPHHPCMDQAIHSAAGPRLRHACRALFPMVTTIDGRRCSRTRTLVNATQVGDVHITPAFCLPCKHILHATGPYNIHATGGPSSSSSPPFRSASAASSSARQLQLLQQTYVHILREADTHGLRSVALACLSTGKFGFSPELACLVALRAVKSYLKSTSTQIHHVVFQVYMAIDEAVYGILGPWVFGEGNDVSTGSTVDDEKSWEIWDESIRQQIDVVKNRRWRGRPGDSITSHAGSVFPPLSVLQSLHYPYQMGSCEVDDTEEEDDEDEDEGDEEDKEAKVDLLASESVDGVAAEITGSLLDAALKEVIETLRDAAEAERAAEIRRVQLEEEARMDEVRPRDGKKVDEEARMEEQRQRDGERAKERALAEECARVEEKHREIESPQQEQKRPQDPAAPSNPNATATPPLSPQVVRESQISLDALETARAQVKLKKFQLAAMLRAEGRERVVMAEEDEESGVLRADARLEDARWKLLADTRAREERALAAQREWEWQEQQQREREAADEAQRVAESRRRADEALRQHALEVEAEMAREQQRAQEAARKQKLALISSRRMNLERETLKVCPRLRPC